MQSGRKQEGYMYGEHYNIMYNVVYYLGGKRHLVGLVMRMRAILLRPSLLFQTYRHVGNSCYIYKGFLNAK